MDDKIVCKLTTFCSCGHEMIFELTQANWQEFCISMHDPIRLLGALSMPTCPCDKCIEPILKRVDAARNN